MANEITTTNKLRIVSGSASAKEISATATLNLQGSGVEVIQTTIGTSNTDIVPAGFSNVGYVVIKNLSGNFVIVSAMNSTASFAQIAPTGSIGFSPSGSATEVYVRASAANTPIEYIISEL